MFKRSGNVSFREMLVNDVVALGRAGLERRIEQNEVEVAADETLLDFARREDHLEPMWSLLADVLWRDLPLHRCEFSVATVVSEPARSEPWGRVVLMCDDGILDDVVVPATVVSIDLRSHKGPTGLLAAADALGAGLERLAAAI